MLKDFSAIGYLKRPSDDFIVINSTLLKSFVDSFGEYKCSVGVVHSVKHGMVKLLENTYPQWSAHCKHLKISIVTHLIDIILNRHIKWAVEYFIHQKVEKN